MQFPKKTMPIPPSPNDRFIHTIDAIGSLRKTVVGTACPSCKQTTLKLFKYTLGPNGFEAEISCVNCGIGGVINSFGFEFKGGKHKQ